MSMTVSIREFPRYSKRIVKCSQTKPEKYSEAYRRTLSEAPHVNVDGWSPYSRTANVRRENILLAIVADSNKNRNAESLDLSRKSLRSFDVV